MKCNLCGCEIEGWGNNPDPLIENEDDRCCDACNTRYVLPARIYQLHHDLPKSEVEQIIKELKRYYHAK